MANTTTRDGKRVAVGTAAAFDRLAAAFKKKFGLTLHVRSGLRTWQEQYNLWLKYKRGGTYALHPDSPQANHVEGNPSGGRSLDLYDSGSDAGVTVAGTKRANWLKKYASKYGFWARGYNFNEPWHVEYQGNPWSGPSTSGGSPTSGSTKGTKVKTYHKQDATARKSGRDLSPGERFYLHLNTGKPQSNASNVVGNPGTYSITAHVYGKGTPGDIVELVLLWQKPSAKDPGKTNSEHYKERLVVDRDGYIRASREFKRGVSRGWAVYARLTAAHNNKSTVKITVFDTDAYLFI